jgi:putative transposase
VVLPGHLHLLIQRAQRGQRAFGDAQDRARYWADLRECAAQYDVAIHAYALLDEEVRLLATPTTEGGLAQMMQSIGRRYVRAFNLRHERSGTPWEGRFRSTVVESQRHFVACLQFVEAPLDSGADAAAWSSLRHHLGIAVDPMITEHPAFFRLGNTPFEREAAYRARIAQPLPATEMAAILRAANHGWALGGADFASLVHQLSGRRQQPRSAGRPRKIRSTTDSVPD